MASACASSVLPTPGTSSTSRWPPASRQMTALRTTASLPSNTLSTFCFSALIRATRCSNSFIPCSCLGAC